MKVAIALFDRLTALDAIGPYEVLQRVPDFDVVFVGAERGEVRTENGMLGLSVDAEYEDVPHPDVIVYPGGVGSRVVMTQERVLRWLREAHRTSLITTSVCTGSLVLGAAGLLDALTATTHWASRHELAALGVALSKRRVVAHWDSRIVTAAGVSSGIDMALTLVARLVDETAAKAAQLAIEYDPEPPFTAGSASSAGAAVRQRVREYDELRD